MMCNINDQGAKQRYMISTLLFLVGVALTVGLNVNQIKDWRIRALVVPTFQIACTTYAQAPARTCYLAAAKGAIEIGKLKFETIASKNRVFEIRLRAVGLFFLSNLVGLLLGGLAFASLNLSFACTPNTCSVFYAL